VTRGFDSGFTLGPWDVRPRLGTLHGPDGEVHIEPKVMGVLLCLAEHAGDVVTRDQFVDQVWQGRIVSDEVLSRCISLLRTRLGDNPREPQFIQTVPKIGYRLIAAAEPHNKENASSPAASETGTATDIPVSVARNANPGKRITLIAIVALAAVLSALLLGKRFITTPPAAATESSIVVLPFINHSDDRDNEYFSDGLTEELIERLARVPGLQVVASTSAFSFKNHREDVRSIARRLGVGYVLEGNVRKENDRVRITAHLVEAERGFRVWSDRYDTRLSGIFGVQDEIANGIVAELRPRLAGGSAGASPVRPTEVMPAYELLLQGRYHLKRREEAPIRRSIELFEEAIELDPGFGEAYRELARAYALLPNYSNENAEAMFGLAAATIERGIARDPLLRDKVHDVRAFLHFSNWEWIEAEEDFRLALAASPNDPTVHQWYSQHLAAVARTVESLEYILEAKKLDVLSPVVNQRLAVAYLWVDDNEMARQQFELADELGMGARANPDVFAVLLFRQREYARARHILVDLQNLYGLPPTWVEPFVAALQDPTSRPAAREALDLAARDGGIPRKLLFGTLTYLGDADAAIEIAFELLSDPVNFDVEFLFTQETEHLRRHARFGELLVAIGLDRYWDEYGWPALCQRSDSAIECS
jgi:TolB-like protein/DNA-binding winged helix-turn-helix (wHTH) protein/tetratricopeptide (TPR) repeat protein